MNLRARSRSAPAFLATLLTALPANAANVPEELRSSFVQWARQSLHPIADSGLDAATSDFRPIERMVHDARIVGISEAVHAATEPMTFRNRLVKHMVEHTGFDAIVLESGVVEGRVLNDFVTEGKGEFEVVVRQGFSWGHETFRQNGELIRWLREHNARLPRDARKVQIFGLDVPGSPGNLDASRRPDTALKVALDYLNAVDAPAAAELRVRVDRFLPALAGTNGYGDLKQAERDALTAAIADLIALLERRRLTYAKASSDADFEWAHRAAMGARQTDTWFRRMPPGWKLADGFAWTHEAMQVRDRAMADNLDWVLRQVGPRGRVLVFASVAHIASTPLQFADGATSVPFGAYAKARFGDEYISILNMVANGEIAYCSRTPRRVMPLKPPPAGAMERAFASLDANRYLLDLRHAPGDVAAWLQQTHEHWNGFAGLRFATSRAFDLLYFVSPVSSDCIPAG